MRLQDIYRNKLDKACFQHYMAYWEFKDLSRKTASDKLLRDKAFNIAKNPKNNGYQRGLASMAYKLRNLLKVVVLNLLLNKINN